MRRRVHFGPCAVGVAVLLALAACGRDQPTAPTVTLPALTPAGQDAITIIDLGPLSTGVGAARGISNSGEVVGDGFVWTARAGVRVVPGWTSFQPSATGVNDRGEIVGSGCPVGGSRCYALFWTAAGELVELPAINILHAINNRGQAVGAAGGAVVWSMREGVRYLEGGWFALDINERGDAVGQSSGARAALWPRGGALVVLPTPAGQPATATGINDRGDVVGFVGPHFYSSGFVWSAAQGLRMLATPDGWYGHPEAINNRGEIVGWILRGGAGSEMHAVWWTAAGELVDLGGLAPGVQNAAYDINNQGLIVGVSDPAGQLGVAHPVLWTAHGTRASVH